jgi:hypothetical protein
VRYSRWDADLTLDDEYTVISELALSHFSQAGRAGEECAVLLFEQDYTRLVQFPVDYLSLSETEAYHLRQGLAFFQKKEDLDLGLDKRAVALSKFAESERSCRLTNETFRKRARGEFSFFPRTERVLYHAARKIASILGKVPSFADLDFRFGPGATTQVLRKMASPRAKLGTRPACSLELAPYLPLLWDEMPTWKAALDEAGPLPLVIHSGTVQFVPKSAKEYRTIMVEPVLNTLVQSGIGSYMARRLRRCGVDIRDQTKNQRLAREGSIGGHLSTIDLSSASDTVATELVFDLLPMPWFYLLSCARTGRAIVGGETLRLEKFSSMGNGYTFPLETLIFYGLSWGVCIELGLDVTNVNAYGDDIIVPTDAYPLLIETLRCLGFKPNMEKSYFSGPFRESCGKDYYHGTDIRPVYIKGRITVADLFRLHNHYWSCFRDEQTRFILSFLDPTIQIFGPPGYGDGHLLSTEFGRRKRSHCERGWSGRVFDTFTYGPRRSIRAYPGDCVLPSYSVYLSGGISSGPSVEYFHGVMSVRLPGVHGYRRISIYTLS